MSGMKGTAGARIIYGINPVVEDGAMASEINVHLRELIKLTGGLDTDAVIEDKVDKGNK